MNYLNNLHDLSTYIDENPALEEYRIHMDNALNMTGDWVNVVLALKGLYLEATEDGNFDVCDRIMDILNTFGD